MSDEYEDFDDPERPASTLFPNSRVLEDRAVVYLPTARGTGKRKDGTEYPYVEGDMIVLNGPVSEDLPEIPCVIKGKRVTGYLARQAELKLGKVVLAVVFGDKTHGTMGNSSLEFQPVPADKTELRQRARAELARYRAANTASDPYSV